MNFVRRPRTVVALRKGKHWLKIEFLSRPQKFINLLLDFFEETILNNSDPEFQSLIS